jgi:hypothetical protein
LFGGIEPRKHHHQLNTTHKLILLLVALGASLTGFAEEDDKRDRTEYLAAETKAMESLGTAKGVDLVLKRGVHSFAGIPAAESHFRQNITSLQGQSIRKALRPFTQKIGSTAENLAVSMEVSTPQDFTAIQKLLGAADAAASHEAAAEVDWHKYGWLEFGVKDGKVRQLRADCLPAKTTTIKK